MKEVLAALWTESLKLCCSKMIWITIAFFAFVPLMMGFLLFIVKNPDIATKMGLMATKAQAIGTADWPTLFKLLKQVISMGGILGFGLVTSWVFGREYSDRTMKDLLALPVSRSIIVLSKIAVIILWCILLSILVFLVGIAIGFVVDLSGWSLNFAISEFIQFGITALLSILLITPVAFFACLGRGYMLPMGFILFAVIITQFANVLGFASYFPWAIPALYSGALGAEYTNLSIYSYIVLFLTSIIGLFFTIFWWRNVDQV
jgi:ABC-2 type transport system permease protein